MAYGKKVDEREVSFNYLKHGINENVKILRVEKADWNGDLVADIIFGDGLNEVKMRLFPFKYNEEYKNKKGVFVTQQEQEDSYLRRVKHIFSKAVGEENFDKAIAKAGDSFESYVNILSKLALDKYPASKPFRLMLTDRGGYANVPTWDNGFCESMEVPLGETKLRYNESDHGPKTKDSTKTEKIKTDTSSKSSSSEEEDDLPF